MAALLMHGGAQETVGYWFFHEQVDRFTDSDASFIVAYASEFPAYARDAGLVITCSDHTDAGYLLAFRTDRYIGYHEKVSVTYRVDRLEALTADWSSTPNGQTVFPSWADAAMLLQQLEDAEQFAVRIQTGVDSLVFVVPVWGFEQALARLACAPLE